MTANERCKKEIGHALESVTQEASGVYQDVRCICYDSLNNQVYNYKCLAETQLALDCCDGRRHEAVPYMSVIALVHDGAVLYQNDRVITNEVYEGLKSVKDDFTQRIVKFRDAEGRISIMEAVKNNGQVKPMAILEVSNKYVKLDIPRKDGKGTFHAITIPKGTEVEGQDLSFYTVLANRVYVDDKNKTVSVPFEFSKELKLTKSVKKEDGSYEKITSYVEAGKVAQAVKDSYEKYKQEQKEAQGAEQGMERAG